MLTQAVAMQVPQSAYVSMVMLDRAVRSIGHSSCQRLSTCSKRGREGGGGTTRS